MRDWPEQLDGQQQVPIMRQQRLWQTQCIDLEVTSGLKRSQSNFGFEELMLCIKNLDNYLAGTKTTGANHPYLAPALIYLELGAVEAAGLGAGLVAGLGECAGFAGVAAGAAPTKVAVLIMSSLGHFVSIYFLPPLVIAS
jgi:hypothetical protein